jgi:hypothetical protein
MRSRLGLRMRPAAIEGGQAALAMPARAQTAGVPFALVLLDTDGLMSLPFLMVAVTIISMLGPSMAHVILVIGLLRRMSYTRILRSEVFKMSEMDYVRLAVVASVTKRSIIVRPPHPTPSPRGHGAKSQDPCGPIYPEQGREGSQATA